jgi:hypothetical protein
MSLVMILVIRHPELDFGQFSKGRIRGMAENMEYAGFIAVSGTAETVRELQPAPEMLAEQAYPPSDKIGQSRAESE